MNKYILLLLIMFSFGACKPDQTNNNIFTNSRSRLLTLIDGEESVKMNEMSTEVIRCFTQNDKDALIELFCDHIRNYPDFNNEIDNLFEFFKCDNYTTSEKSKHVTSGISTNEGRRTEWYISASIPYISVLVYREKKSAEDMERRYYAIYYSWCIINEKNRSYEGLYYMSIELLNINNIKMGDRDLLWN